jgi:hypothetical protein
MYRLKLQVTALFIAICVFIVVIKICDVQGIQIANPVVEMWQDFEHKLNQTF